MEVLKPYCDLCADDNCPGGYEDSACIVYHRKTPKPSKLYCLGIGNSKNLDYILDKIDARFCQIAGSQLPLKVNESPTIKFSVSGLSSHTLTGVVKLSTDNGIKVIDGGLYMAQPNGRIKVDGTDASDFLVNKLLGGTDDIIYVSVFEQDGVVVAQPSLDIDKLIKSILENHVEEWCEILNNCGCDPVLSLAKEYSDPCPDGYELVGDVCQKTETADPTLADDILFLEAQTNANWSKGGAIVFVNGYDVNGQGPGDTLFDDLLSDDVVRIATSDVWLNGITGPYDGNNNVLLGPMNRAGVWTTPYSANTSFIIRVNVPETKTYFIGLGVDNYATVDIIKPDGTTENILTEDADAGMPYFGGTFPTWTFDLWRIYPVELTAGINYLKLEATDGGGAKGFAAEIYDNTLAELQAAALVPAYISSPSTFPYGQNHYSNLNLIFTTRCARKEGAISANSATCPSGYSLNTTAGDTPVQPCQSVDNPVSNWECQKITQTAFGGYTATLSWTRIATALRYDIQQKDVSTEGVFEDSVGSPLANPGSGSSVSIDITDLDSDTFVFRVRPDYGSCKGMWSQV